MKEEIIYIDVSEILEGKLPELKAALKELVDFVDTNEPLPFTYNFYFNQENTRMTLIQVHPNSESLEFHLKVAGSMFPKFATFIKLQVIEIYGNVSDNVLKQLNKKAEMLGAGSVQSHQLQSGFTRLTTN